MLYLQCLTLLGQAGCGKGGSNVILAQIKREEFDAAGGNAESSGQVVIEAQILPRAWGEKINELLHREREKEAKKAAKLTGGA